MSQAKQKVQEVKPITHKEFLELPRDNDGKLKDQKTMFYIRTSVQQKPINKKYHKLIGHNPNLKITTPKDVELSYKYHKGENGQKGKFINDLVNYKELIMSSFRTTLDHLLDRFGLNDETAKIKLKGIFKTLKQNNIARDEQYKNTIFNHQGKVMTSQEDTKEAIQILENRILDIRDTAKTQALLDEQPKQPVPQVNQTQQSVVKSNIGDEPQNGTTN
jgi:polyhydroxyalkanoate synthesis regulator phasin